MTVRNEPVPEGESPGEVAIEMGAIYITIEKTAALTAALIDKLRPALNVEAFSTKDAEETPQPALCPLAAELRRDKRMIREAVNGKLSELLRFIEL